MLIIRIDSIYGRYVNRWKLILNFDFWVVLIKTVADVWRNYNSMGGWNSRWWDLDKVKIYQKIMQKN